MLDALASGRLIDLILVFVALEAVLLAVLPRSFPFVPTLQSLWPNLLAGACLMLALRFALADQPITWVAGALVASLIAHGVEIGRRMKKV